MSQEPADNSISRALLELAEKSSNLSQLQQIRADLIERISWLDRRLTDLHAENKNQHQEAKNALDALREDREEATDQLREETKANVAELKREMEALRKSVWGLQRLQLLGTGMLMAITGMGALALYILNVAKEVIKMGG